jgi:hypothetical protein
MHEHIYLRIVPAGQQEESALSTLVKEDLHALGRLWSSRKLDETDVLELTGGNNSNFLEASNGGGGDDEDCDVLGVLYMSQVT